MAFSLSDYTDKKELSRGGMGLVYTATQVSLARKVVIKQMATNLGGDAILIKRFENEAKSAAALDHDNIIKIYDFGEEGGAFYIVMEYADGPNLDDVLSDRHVPREIGLMALLQAAKGLQYAHEHGIIHRDIKPGNILICKNGRVKVLDFGLAYAGEESANLTATNAIVGTPLYMSPEQATSVKERNVRSDIFSMGVILYRVVTGRLPFTGTNVPSILYNIIHTKEQHVQDVVPSLPDDLAAAITASLEKNIDKRLDSLTPVIEALQNYFYDLGIRDTAEELARQLANQSTGLNNFIKGLLGYHLKKGKEYAESGEYRKSSSHFKEALKYDPNNEEVKKFVNEIESVEATIPHLSVSSTEGPAITAHSVAPKKKRRGVKVLIAAGILVLLLVIAGASGLFEFVLPLPDYLSAAYVWNRIQGIVPEAPAAPEPVVRPPAPAPATPAAPVVTEQVTQPPAPVVQEPPARIREKADKRMARRELKARARPPAAAPAQEKLPAAPPAAPAASAPEEEAGLLSVMVDPPSAAVFLDGNRLPQDRIRQGIKAAPGNRSLSATADGFEPYNATVTITRGAIQSVSIALKPLVRGTGFLHVFSTPWSEVFVDGQRMGIAPTSKPLALPEGRHVIVLQREGFAPYEEIVEIGRDQKVQVKAKLEPPVK